MIDGIEMIRAERETQIGKGYTAAYDDAYHEAGQLASVAAYMAALQTNRANECNCDGARLCGVRLAAKCEGDRIRELTVAGSLIVAEIERLQRAGT